MPLQIGQRKPGVFFFDSKLMWEGPAHPGGQCYSWAGGPGQYWKAKWASPEEQASKQHFPHHLCMSSAPSSSPDLLQWWLICGIISWNNPFPLQAAWLYHSSRSPNEDTFLMSWICNMNNSIYLTILAFYTLCYSYVFLQRVLNIIIFLPESLWRSGFTFLFIFIQI